MSVLCGILLSLSQPNTVRAEVPVVETMGAIETAGTSGSRPHIAADNQGQPHVVAQGDRGVLKLYDRIGGTWRTPVYFNSSSELNFPRTAIDQHNNRQWVSAVMIQYGNVNACGMAILTRSTVSSTPSGVFAIRDTIGDPSGIPLAMIDLDAGKTDLAYVYGNYGVWQEFGVNPNGSVRVTANHGSKLLTRNVGERNLYGFAISPAGGMWHASYNGHPWLSSVRYSGYLNDARVSAHQGEAAWNDPSIYVGAGGADEDKYQAICADAKNNKAAYFAIYGNNGRIYVNIYNGTAMVYPYTSPLSMSSDSGISRYAPQWATAKDGGAWLCWQNNGRILTRYFGLDGVHGSIIDVAAGSTGTIATDIDGNVHIAYMGGGNTRYRKLTIGGFEPESPIGTITDTMPAFVWNDNGAAPDQYRVVVHDATNGVVADVTTNGTTKSIPCPIALGFKSYKWLVGRVTGASTKWTDFADFRVTLAAPKLLYPITNAPISTTNDLRFSWTRVTNASSYHIIVKRDSTAVADFWSLGSARTNWVPTNIETWTAGNYSWWIWSTNALVKVVCEQPAAGLFKLAAPPVPVILRPVNKSIAGSSDRIIFEWTASRGATGYDLQIYKGGVFAWNVSTTGETSYSSSLRQRPYPLELDADSYQWWVRAQGVYGSSAWSASNAFFKARAMNPSNGLAIAPLRPVFSWSATSGTTKYRLWLNRNSAKYQDLYLDASLLWIPTFDLPYGAYEWWIQAWKGSVAGPWLKSASFVIPKRTPGAATLYNPTGIVAVAGNQLFAWTNVPVSTWYEFYISRNGRKYADKWINGNAVTTTLHAVTAADYGWWIRTWNVDGYGPWSAGQTFSCDKCRIVAPLKGTVITQSPVQLRWLGLPTAINYEVWLNRNGARYRFFKTGSPATTWTATETWPAGSYQWWVRDIDTTGAGIWSLSSTFRMQ